jgi:hypothetical protein
VAIAVAALLIVGCESDGDEPVGDVGTEGGPGGSVLDAPANPAALQRIWGSQQPAPGPRDRPQHNQRILGEQGIDPAPLRSKRQPWATFI